MPVRIGTIDAASAILWLKKRPGYAHCSRRMKGGAQVTGIALAPARGVAVTRSRYGNGDRGQDFARFERGEIDALIELACGDLHFPRTTRSLFYASDRWVCISGDIIRMRNRYEKVVKVVIAKRSK